MASDEDNKGLGFVKFYQSLAEKPNTTVRIFDRADYYTVHGNDALLAATEFFHTHTVIKLFGAGNHTLQSVSLSKAHFEAFLRDLLLVKQYRVEVFRRANNDQSSWKVEFKASPGNLQQLEEVLFGGGGEEEVTSTVLAISYQLRDGLRNMGVAYWDVSRVELGVAEFVDNDHFSNLEAVLVQYAPKECVVVGGDGSSDGTKIRQTLQRSNVVVVTKRKKAEFKIGDIAQDLGRLLKLEDGATANTLPQLALELAMGSLSALIKYLELLSDESNFGMCRLTSFDLSQYMRLDSTAVVALNLDPQPNDSRLMYLSGLLNKCCTSQGQRLLGQWVKQPLLDKNKIDERLDLVECFFSDAHLRVSLQQEHLKCVPDLFRLSKRLQRGNGSLQDCVRIYQAASRLPLLISALEEHEGTHRQLLTDVFITPINELSSDLSKFCEMVESTIDLDMVEHREFVIKPDFDDGLTQLRQEMEELESKMNSQCRKAANELGLEPLKTIKLESNSQLGHYLRITKKVDKCLRGQSKFITLETRNDGTKFTTSSLRSLGEDYRALKNQYQSLQASLASEVAQIAAGYAEPLLELNLILSRLDVIVSFACVSATAPTSYVRPTITNRGEGDIVLKGARHPLVEMQDEMAFIPNDITLLRDKDSFQIITGPNMGGKSTYIKQAGVIVLMAQIGCFVPCESASLPVMDAILARVGASDSQMKGVSTFMAEMLESAIILRTATKDSLVIIDELGRGTSTYDGFGLAWAISHTSRRGHHGNQSSCDGHHSRRYSHAAL
ncbi:DNA mismatch repair protein Msh2-like isoform X2 [Halichondria panicea]|uniref:DNA mismatch repair protein Msh2-like isoform X2 n=1 Tax=Halichondria panicea TaxID=6063 RepID=UPI00312BACFF